jgi:hypothetical protein
MELVSFKAEHLAKIEKQTGKMYPEITSTHRALLEKNNLTFSVVRGDRIFLCGGVIQYWPGRGEVWAIFDKEIKGDFFRLHKIALRFLDVLPMKRIEAVVNVDFKQGHRWAKLLGFKLDSERLKHYFSDGADAALYSRVR